MAKIEKLLAISIGRMENYLYGRVSAVEKNYEVLKAILDFASQCDDEEDRNYVRRVAQVMYERAYGYLDGINNEETRRPGSTGTEQAMIEKSMDALRDLEKDYEWLTALEM